MDQLAEWKATRSPRLADAIETQGPEKAWVRIAKLPGSRAKTAILQLAKTVDDPRLATLYLTWLAQGNWPAPTAKVVWTRIFEHLAAIRDVRAIAPLRAVAADLPPFVGEAHRAWMVSMIEGTADKLAAVVPAKDAAHAPAKRAPAPAVADPAAPVWSNPDDEDLRQVVADALTERGDPQGEFITLQLLPTKNAAQRRRERELLAEHAAAWLGAIGALALDGSSRFVAGFPCDVAVDRRAVPRRAWEAALAAPQWATIRRLCVSILHTPKWWITAWVAAGHGDAFEVGEVASKRPALRLERAGDAWRVASAIRGYTSSCVPILRAFVGGLSPEQRAAMTLAKDLANRDAYAAVLAG